MPLSVGIVGLPNVGKSTLFNALSNAQADAANYAFCTINPNVGVVSVPDPRFDSLVDMFAPNKAIPATVEFVDIAGLVRGASKGEGKGNSFLSHIRTSDALAHVIRCFKDDRIIHVDHRVDPISDIETIETELILKDLETVQRRLEKAKKNAKGQIPLEKKAIPLCEHLIATLNNGHPATIVQPNHEDEAMILRDMFLLTRKPSLFIANVSEDQLANADHDPLIAPVYELAQTRGVPIVVISAAIESEIMQLPQTERAEFIESLGLKEPGLHQLIRTSYATLRLITYFTAGKPEVHAWTIQAGTLAPQAAAKIHNDFERGFIRAEVMKCNHLFELGSEQAVKAAGKLAVEGKDYVVQDGDIMYFRINP